MSATQDIPYGWRRFSLRELHAGGVGSIDPRDFPDESFEYYSIPAYQDASSPLLTPGKEIQSQKLLIPGACLLFGKLNPRVEKVWNVRSTSPLRRAASTEWLPIVPIEDLDQDFGHYLLRSDWVMPIAQSLVSGSTPSRERVEPKAFYDIVVPLPGPQEQKGIARVMSLLDDHVKKQNELLERLADLKSVAMRELFTRGLRDEAQRETEIGLIPESWEIVPLGSLGRIGNGSTPKKTVPAYWIGGTFPWLTSAKVYDREIESADQFVTGVALDECHLPRVQPGAVLMAITGQGKTLGHCAVLKTEASISQHIAYLQTNTEKAEPGYVRGYLETQYDYLRQVASGGGSTKGALTCAFLRDFPLPLPPALEEQREIVAILDALDRKIALHRQKRAVLEAMFKSLLHQLMTGEIRVTDLELPALPAAQGLEPVT
jgi:type I restriction enzyme S subunit